MSEFTKPVSFRHAATAAAVGILSSLLVEPAQAQVTLTCYDSTDGTGIPSGSEMCDPGVLSRPAT